MKTGRVSINKVGLLKIDKDCHLDSVCVYHYVDAIRAICRINKVKVTLIEMTNTSKGHHFYIRIRPTVSAHRANWLQFLLGDDPRRFDYNRARIRSRYTEWNKLFEEIGRRFRVLYCVKVPAGARKTPRREG